jgi:hypothetical protein
MFLALVRRYCQRDLATINLPVLDRSLGLSSDQLVRDPLSRLQRSTRKSHPYHEHISHAQPTRTEIRLRRLRPARS